MNVGRDVEQWKGATVFDVVLRGGWVADGTGAPPFRADVAVSDGRVADVGTFPGARGATDLDVAGRLVMPGFVDAHVHADSAVLSPDVQLAALRQGVTTVVVGQDGLSYAPGGPATVEYVARYFAAVNGVHPDLPGTGATVADLLDGYAGRVPLNVAYLLPHGTIRYEVMGAAARPATGDECDRMVRLVQRGLDDGAVGLSSGFDYAPGRYADVAELARLAAPVARSGLPYVSHLRGYEDRAPDGFAELRDVAQCSGVAVHASHYHGPADVLAPLVDGARDAGVDATFDTYPYLRGSSILAMVTLPDWLPLADLDATRAALSDPDVRARLAREWAGDPGRWPRLTLTHVPDPELRWAEGMSLAEAAERAGAPPERFCVDVLAATDLSAGCVFAHPPTNTEDSVRALLRHPAQMGGSDGIYVGGHPHPRAFGAFARLLARHVRELGDWTWSQAAVHLSAHPSRRFQLPGRGAVRRGAAADLVVIDPDEVADRASYERPRELAAGVEHVWVAGTRVLADGELTGALPGAALRPYSTP